MVSVKVPIIPVDLSPEAATYVGLLERQLALMSVQEAKFRALFELWTGEPWEATQFDIDSFDMLMDVAVQGLVKKTGMRTVDAKTLVQQRWNSINKPTTRKVPKSVPIEEFSSSEAVQSPSQAPSMRDRYQEYKKNKAAQDNSPTE